MIFFKNLRGGLEDAWLVRIYGYLVPRMCKWYSSVLGIVTIQQVEPLNTNEKKSFISMETACSRFSFLKILRQAIWTPFSIMLHNDISNFWENAIFLQTISHQKMCIQIIAESNLIYSISRFHSLFSTNFSNKWARAPSQKLHKKTLFLSPNSSLGNLSCCADFLSESKI